MQERFVIGSRGSKLALWQAEWVRAKISALHPEAEVHIEIIRTSGDVLRDAPLAVIGGKGVFTKELEEALLDRRIDIAVHSLKDLPTVVCEGLVITAITEREDPRDALVLRADLPREFASIKNLPGGAVVGTSSPRRLAQLKHFRRDLVIKELRGNVDTRLRKLDAGAYDAVVLASAGLRRLGFDARISAPLAPEEMLPAVGQGALGVEIRADEHAIISLVAHLNHPATRAACTAERALLRALGGGCQLPIAAHATMGGDMLRLEGLVASVSGDQLIRDSADSHVSEAAEIGEKLAARIRERGADSLLAETAN